jgi:hypothetical protein
MVLPRRWRMGLWGFPAVVLLIDLGAECFSTRMASENLSFDDKPIKQNAGEVAERLKAAVC